MSSPREVSVWGSELGAESEEHSEEIRFTHGFPRRLNPDEGLLRNIEDKMYLPVSKTFQYDSGLDGDNMDGRSVIWGCEGRPGTPVDGGGDSMDIAPQLTEGTSFGQYVVNQEDWSVRVYLTPRSFMAEPLGICGDSDAGTSRRGMWAPTSVEEKVFSDSQLHPWGLGQGASWVTPRRGATSMIIASEDFQYLPSKNESSDEFSETEMRSRTISLKEGGRARSTGLTQLEETGKHASVPSRGSFVHVRPSVRSSANRALSSGMEKQASGELEDYLSKKKQSGVWGKEGSRPGYPGAAAATFAAVPAPVAIISGAFPKTSPRKKPVKEKPPQWDALGGTFTTWGQRLKSAPVEATTFPPIAELGLLEKGREYTLPSEPEEYKPFCTGKRSTARKTKESQAGAKEDNDPGRDPGLQAQLSAACMPYYAEMSSGNPNTRAPQVAGNPRFLSRSQRSARPRAPAASDTCKFLRKELYYCVKKSGLMETSISLQNPLLTPPIFQCKLPVQSSFQKRAKANPHGDLQICQPLYQLR
ncbi:hypothetical protein STEG23_023788 [Scotinomys teguina]